MAIAVSIGSFPGSLVWVVVVLGSWFAIGSVCCVVGYVLIVYFVGSCYVGVGWSEFVDSFVTSAMLVVCMVVQLGVIGVCLVVFVLGLVVTLVFC